MYITITAGHSNTDPGAVNGSDREADIAQDMRNIVASILRTDFGLEVKTDGEGKGNLPLREAVKLIKGSRLAVEFHTNAALNKTATGIEALSMPSSSAAYPSFRSWNRSNNREIKMWMLPTNKSLLYPSTRMAGMVSEQAVSESYWKRAYNLSDDDIVQVASPPNATPASPLADFAEHRPAADAGLVIDTLAPLSGSLNAQGQALTDILIGSLKQGAATPEAVLDRLTAAYPNMDDAALQEELARLIFLAELVGRVEAAGELAE